MRKLLFLLPLFTLPAVLTGCSGAGAAPTPTESRTNAIDLSGTWTVTTVSTNGQGASTGTATITQSGSGIGVDGTTTLAAPIGQISLSQTGTTIGGTITNLLSPKTFNFSGTLSSGTINLTGTAPCEQSKALQATTITGTVAASAIRGNYTIARPSDCFFLSDAGTFVATKQQ